MNIQNALIARINEICKEKNSNICKICLNGGMSPSNIYDIIKKRTANTSIVTIAKFCDGAKITIAEFFDSPLFIGLSLWED